VVCGKLTVGATGAVSSFKGYGIDSCTRNAAGKYTLVLSKAHAALVGASIMQIAATAADITAQILSEDVDNPTTASRTIVVQLKAAATGTDAAAASVILFTFFFADSSVLGFGPETVS
jgi:hypothetical protein